MPKPSSKNKINKSKLFPRDWGVNIAWFNPKVNIAWFNLAVRLHVDINSKLTKSSSNWFLLTLQLSYKFCVLLRVYYLQIMWKNICFSISLFSHLFLHLSLTFLSFSESPLAVVSLLGHLLKTTTLYLRWTTLGNVMGVRRSWIIRKLSKFIELSIIESSILCLLSRVNHIINCIANRFAINSKPIVG